MAKPPKKPKPEEIEADLGAWDRFERAVDSAVKSGPKHRTASGKKVPPKRKPPKGGKATKKPGK